MNREELIALSSTFVGYLFRETNLKDRIKHIYLFGSVARNDFDEQSDIDIFIDVESKDEKDIEKIAQRALGKFYRIEGEKWRLRGIKNELSLKTGALAEWQLKSSIEKEGLVLFSQTVGQGLKKCLLYSFEPIKSSQKRIKVMRKLFGRQEKNYREQGLVKEVGGKMLGSRVFIVPSRYLQEVSSFLAKEKVQFQFEEIWQ